MLELEAELRDLAVTPTHVYATYADSTWGAVIRLPIGGGAIEKLAPDAVASLGHEGRPNAITLDSQFVYYTGQRHIVVGGQGNLYSDEGIFEGRPR